MATFDRFEDILIWQRARSVCREVYVLTRVGAFARDFGLRDQIQRASVSVMANVAEGAGRGGNREFVQFLAIARGSNAEVRSHLFAASDAGYMDADIVERLVAENRQIERMISGLINSLRSTPHNGSRTRPVEPTR